MLARLWDCPSPGSPGDSPPVLTGGFSPFERDRPLDPRMRSMHESHHPRMVFATDITLSGLVIFPSGVELYVSWRSMKEVCRGET